MDDQHIVELFIARSETAIPVMEDAYGRLCKSIMYRILENEQDIEECMNDVLLAVWNQIPPNKPNPLRAYVCKIARNLAITRYKNNSAIKRNSQYDTALDELTDVLSSDETVEENYEARELREAINGFLAVQKKMDRILFTKRFYFFESIREIAKETGCSCNYISVHLHRTKERLKKYLEKEGLI